MCLSMEKELKEKKNKSSSREIIEALLIAIVLALVIRWLLFQPFYIPSSSMEPTLQINDRIIVSKLSYFWGEPQRGDIVVFKYPLDTKKDFVKRLIGMPGDTIEVKDGLVYINEKVYDEDYLPEDLVINGDFGPVVVPAGNYFMMGDNRNNSDDSRFWGFLPEDLIVGKSIIIYWPFNHVELL